MGNGGSTKKCSTEKKCSYFTLEVFEKYLIKLDIFLHFIMHIFAIFQLFIPLLW